MVWQPRQPQRNNRLSRGQSIALLYHDIFEYPLKSHELVKWEAGPSLGLNTPSPRVETKDSYFFLKGKKHLVGTRLDKEYVSRKKLKILALAKVVLERNKNILLAGLTGSLAMVASRAESDIDILIITKKGKMWQTRLWVLAALVKNKIATRRAGNSNEADKLCLNIWMDETDLAINTKNVYTAHELAQIVPVINRDNCYEKLLAINSWILDYWPNSVQVVKRLSNKAIKNNSLASLTIEKFVYLLQRLYMSGKITREVVTPTRAFFHPFDWSRKVAHELARRGIVQVSTAS